MYARAVGVAVLFAVVSLAQGQDPAKKLNPNEAIDLYPPKLTVGEYGRFTTPQGRAFKFRTLRIIDGKKMIVGSAAYSEFPFIASGIATDDLTEDMILELPGLWLIKSPVKAGSRRYLVAELQK